MPTYATGLSGQLMVAPEGTVGTAVTTTIGYEILNESVNYIPTFLDGMGIAPGQPYQRIARTIISRGTIDGPLSLEHSDKGHMALLWKHCLGSTLTVPVVIGATTAYESYLTPGTKAGFGLTAQFGRPQTSGPTIQPFTYAGCKVASWVFTVTDNSIATLTVTLDGWTESTSIGLAASSLTAGAGVFSFADAAALGTSFKLGGTPSTAAGKTTIASGVTVASVVKGITITGTTPLADQRFGLGNAGIKREQFENAIQTITVSLDSEFTSRTEFYDLLKANTNTSLQLDFAHFDSAGKDAGGVNAGPNPYLLSFIFPAMKIINGAMNIAGTDILPQKIDMKAYSNGVDPVMQVHTVSTDTTL